MSEPKEHIIHLVPRWYCHCLEVLFFSVRNTLPFQLPRWLFWFVVVFCPRSVTLVRDYWMERKLRKEQEEQEQS